MGNQSDRMVSSSLVDAENNVLLSSIKANRQGEMPRRGVLASSRKESLGPPTPELKT